MSDNTRPPTGVPTTPTARHLATMAAAGNGLNLCGYIAMPIEHESNDASATLVQGNEVSP